MLRSVFTFKVSESSLLLSRSESQNPFSILLSLKIKQKSESPAPALLFVMASSSVVFDSDEEKVEFTGAGHAHTTGLFQVISHKDKPRDEEHVPAWALAKPVGVESAADAADSSTMEDSQRTLVLGEEMEYDGRSLTPLRELQEQKALKRKGAFCSELSTPPSKVFAVSSPPAADDAPTVTSAGDENKKKIGENDTNKDKDKKEIKKVETKGKDKEVIPMDTEKDQEIKEKAAALVNDPKYKKGTALSSLSPNSQEVMKEIRKIRQRQSSDLWHAQWESKGKPKEDASAEKVPEAPEVAAPEAPEVTAPDVPEAPGDEAQPPVTLSTARVPWLLLILID